LSLTYFTQAKVYSIAQNNVIFAQMKNIKKITKMKIA